MMGRVKHWTPAYLCSRVAEIAEHRRNPSHPWLTKQAVEFLSGYLRPADLALETGSGRSTIYIASRVKHLISLEHDTAWHQKVSAGLEAAGVRNVDYRLLPEEGVPQSEDERYVQFVCRLEDESLDFALIDGAFRDLCAHFALRKLRPGGLLAIDNANWFLRSRSTSPQSRGDREQAPTKYWAEVESRIKDWRSYWTTSGVTDTAFFFKPNRVFAGESR